VETDRPGQEVSSAHSRVIKHLIENEGWAYKLPPGRGYPRLHAPSGWSIRVPRSGHSKGHALENWLAAIRRNDGHWPPGRNMKRKLEEAGEQ
jgi:hypothetical protein